MYYPSNLPLLIPIWNVDERAYSCDGQSHNVFALAVLFKGGFRASCRTDCFTGRTCNHLLRHAMPWWLSFLLIRGVPKCNPWDRQLIQGTRRFLVWSTRQIVQPARDGGSRNRPSSKRSWQEKYQRLAFSVVVPSFSLILICPVEDSDDNFYCFQWVLWTFNGRNAMKS